MSNFEKFKEAFNNEFEEGIGEFIYEYEGTKGVIPFGGKEIEDLDDINHDSYGNEDSKLERIYYFEEFDIYISFEGTRCSYSGEDWDDFKEVKQATKTIQFWEKVN
jgi:hypothetical protein